MQQTLEAFGIIVKIAEIDEYKEYVKFCYEVSVGTGLNRILNLSRDLALAIASPTGKVVIEAPIPGRSLIGISVPKSKQSKINLKLKPVRSLTENLSLQS